MMLKGQRIRKVLDLISLSTCDVQNLSCTSPSKAILKLDPHEIDLVSVFKEFIKVEKLGLRSDFYSISFEEFSNACNAMLT